MTKKLFTRIVIALIAVILIATVVLYAILPEWKAFYLACAGGVIVVNLLLSLFFAYKNMK